MELVQSKKENGQVFYQPVQIYTEDGRLVVRPLVSDGCDDGRWFARYEDAARIILRWRQPDHEGWGPGTPLRWDFTEGDWHEDEERSSDVRTTQSYGTEREDFHADG